MDQCSTHSIFYGRIEIPTSHVNPYAVDESVLLYDPLPEDIIKDNNRNIFNNVAITPEEENILEGFFKYICNDYLVKNKCKLKETIEWLCEMEPEFLRFLYSAGFDYKRTLETMFMNYQFRKSNMLPAVLDDIEDELNDGHMYWFGRDLKYRPTLVADVFKLQNLTMEKLVKLVVLCFEFFLRYLHVGGKSENYNVLIDCENRGVVQLPVQMIIQLTEIMHSKYRGRLNNLFLVNSPNLINVILKPLKGVLSERVLKKMVIVKQDSREELISLYDPKQLQQRFGGEFPDLTSNYYPFQFFPNSCQSNGKENDNKYKLDEEINDMDEDNKSSSTVDSKDLDGGCEGDSLKVDGKNKDSENSKRDGDKDTNEEENYLVKNYTIIRMLPSVLYGRCMVVNKYLSDYLKELFKAKVDGDYSDLVVNDNNEFVSKYRNKWYKNIRYYMLSREAGEYLMSRLPELKEEIELSTIKSRKDLIRFINNIN